MSRWRGNLALQVAADHAEEARPKVKGKTPLEANTWHVVPKDGESKEGEIAAFLSRIPKVKPNECAIWTGQYLYAHGKTPIPRFQTRGYRKRMVMAGRYAWQLVHGPIKKGGMLYHTCFNNACMTVRHMWIGTQKDCAAYMAKMGYLAAKHKRAIGNGPTQRKARALCEKILADLAELRRMHSRTYNAFRKTLRKPLPREPVTDAWRAKMRDTARQRSPSVKR